MTKEGLPESKKRVEGVEVKREKKRNAPELKLNRAYVLNLDAGIWEESSGETHATAHMEEVVVGKGKTILDAPAGGACEITTFFDKGKRLGAVIHTTSLDDGYKRYIDALLEDVSFSLNSEIHCCVDLIAPELPPGEEKLIDLSGYESELTDWLGEVVDYLISKGFNKIKTVTEGYGKDVTLYTDTGKVEVLDENEKPILTKKIITKRKQ